MMRLMTLALLLTPALTARAEFRPKTEPELTHRQDGDDLITSTTILVPGGAHLVLTTFDNTDALMPGLRYTVIRIADNVDNGWRPGKIEWRLKGFAKAHPGLAPYRVSGQVIALSMEELRGLGWKALDQFQEKA
jgi:hypothetical protein